MQLNLTDSQVNALLLAIDSYDADLREEIYHTDDDEFRQSLQDVAHALEGIRDQVEPGWQTRREAGTGGPAPPAPRA